MLFLSNAPAMGRHTHWLRAAMLSAGLVAGCAGTMIEPDPDPDPPGSPIDGSSDTFVHLFEWPWLDIAHECEVFLGPKGYAAVQISPPNEHILHDAWWARYQPVSYKLTSRGGTRAALIEMVERCNAAGVAIYADLVLNHTAALDGGGTGVAGTAWSYKNHPDMGYGPAHYHGACAIDNYSSADNVQNCELLGLPDLNTGDPYVQDRIAAYMQDLLDIGVAGFRLDAAKHMAAADLQEILAQAGNPWVFAEVIGAAGEAVQPAWYTDLGEVTEFGYSRDLGNAFLAGGIASLQSIADDKLDSGHAVVFSDNHDNQRGHGAGYQPITFQNGSRYSLANAFMLAWPYGHPKVMSSYVFESTDQGPPAGTGGCDQLGRVCEHRFIAIANMVAFRRITSGEPVVNWWDDGDNRIAFGRGDKGFIAINNTAEPMVESLQTGLAAGTYCNIAAGEVDAGGCTGPSVIVDANGMADIDAQPFTAVAMHTGAMASAARQAP